MITPQKKRKHQPPTLVRRINRKKEFPKKDNDHPFREFHEEFKKQMALIFRKTLPFLPACLYVNIIEGYICDHDFFEFQFSLLVDAQVLKLEDGKPLHSVMDYIFRNHYIPMIPIKQLENGMVKYIEQFPELPQEDFWSQQWKMSLKRFLGPTEFSFKSPTTYVLKIFFRDGTQHWNIVKFFMFAFCQFYGYIGFQWFWNVCSRTLVWDRLSIFRPYVLGLSEESLPNLILWAKRCLNNHKSHIWSPTDEKLYLEWSENFDDPPDTWHSKLEISRYEQRALNKDTFLKKIENNQ